MEGFIDFVNVGLKCGGLLFTSELAWKGDVVIDFGNVGLVDFQILGTTFHEPCLVAFWVTNSFLFSSAFYWPWKRGLVPRVVVVR